METISTAAYALNITYTNENCIIIKYRIYKNIPYTKIILNQAFNVWAKYFDFISLKKK